jgi:hypothetical protein
VIAVSHSCFPTNAPSSESPASPQRWRDALRNRRQHGDDEVFRQMLPRMAFFDAQRYILPLYSGPHP